MLPGGAKTGRRSFPAALAAVGFIIGFKNQHVWLLMFLPLTFLFPAEDREWLWRWQATILYGFAAIAKITPDYLSGRVVERRLGDVSEVITIGLSIAGLLIEAFLAFGLWRWRWAKWVGIAFRISVVGVMSLSLLHVFRLSVFAALVLIMYPAFRPSRRRSSAVATDMKHPLHQLSRGTI